MFTYLENTPWLRKKILILFGIIIVLLTIVEIWAVNRLSTYGDKLSKLEETKAKIELENQVLENEIAIRSSLNEIKDQAYSLGFDRIKKVEFVKSSDLASN